MGNFRYCKKYNGIEEHFDVAQEVKERIIGYIWKELNNNNYNKILLGPLSINNNVEEIKFEEKDERIKIKSYPKEVSDIDYQNETTNGVPSNDDEEEDEVDYIK